MRQVHEQFSVLTPVVISVRHPIGLMILRRHSLISMNRIMTTMNVLATERDKEVTPRRTVEPLGDKAEASDITIGNPYTRRAST